MLRLCTVPRLGYVHRRSCSKIGDTLTPVNRGRASLEEAKAVIQKVETKSETQKLCITRCLENLQIT